MIDRYSLFAADTWGILLRLSFDLDAVIQDTKYRPATQEECQRLVQTADRAVNTVSFTCNHLLPNDEIRKAVSNLKSAYLELFRDRKRISMISLSTSITDTLGKMRTAYEKALYLPIDQENQIFLKTDDLFGDLVVRKFPSLTVEIQSAGQCLALKQPTACVFHLMRVMEASVKRFGKKLKIQINVDTENWATIISRINGKIDQLPKTTRIQQRRKAKYAEASTYLNSIRIAWRNEVMHPHENYSNDQARKILFLVRDFLIHLAELM